MRRRVPAIFREVDLLGEWFVTTKDVLVRDEVGAILIRFGQLLGAKSPPSPPGEVNDRVVLCFEGITKGILETWDARKESVQSRSEPPMLSEDDFWHDCLACPQVG